MATKVLVGMVLVLSGVVLFLLSRSPLEPAAGGGLVGAAQAPLAETDEGAANELMAADAPVTRAEVPPVGEAVEAVEAVEAKMSQEASLEEEAPEGDPLAGLVDFNLGDGVFERQLAVDRRLAELTREAFAAEWEHGQIYNISEMGTNPYEDEQGRPRPCEVRRVGGGSQTMVILPEEQFPDVWVLMQAKKDILEEMSEMQRSVYVPKKNYR